MKDLLLFLNSMRNKSIIKHTIQRFALLVGIKYSESERNYSYILQYSIGRNICFSELEYLSFQLLNLTFKIIIGLK